MGIEGTAEVGLSLGTMATRARAAGEVSGEGPRAPGRLLVEEWRGEELGIGLI